MGAEVRGLPALVILSVGCSEASAPPVEACTDDQAVTIHVSAGMQPAFTWTPACASNPLRSGIRYGQAPPGTFEATPPAALQGGTEYEVLVYRWLGEPGGEGGPFQRGSTTFRP
jgi:hypothetical protein